MITVCVQKSLETTIFIGWKQLGPDNNTYLAQIITPEKAKLGPDNNFTAYIYIYIYFFFFFLCFFLGGDCAEKPHKKKIKFLGTEVPRNFSDQCSLDFAYFLCLFSGRRAKSSQELCSWELFFLILGGFSPSVRVAKTLFLENPGFVWGTPAIFVIFVGFWALRSATPCFCG